MHSPHLCITVYDDSTVSAVDWTTRQQAIESVLRESLPTGAASHYFNLSTGERYNRPEDSLVPAARAAVLACIA
jgi:hypothetical protein